MFLSFHDLFYIAILQINICDDIQQWPWEEHIVTILK